ncbi:MAG: DUF5752 family protein [Syntrophobacteraceae bacterium]
MAEPFAIKDCALTAISTGEKAQNLRELRDRLLTIHAGSIYYHFWGGLLRPGFEEPEYQNDFAAWAYRGLRQTPLAEKLALINPSEFADIEDLRREIIDIIEETLEETEFVPWAKANQQFYFIRSQMVVFDTTVRIERPEDFLELTSRLSVGSVFYHFIDARRRTDTKKDDFSEWLLGFGDTYTLLVERLCNVDPYFSTLTELRREIEAIFKEYLREGE